MYFYPLAPPVLSDQRHQWASSSPRRGGISCPNTSIPRPTRVSYQSVGSRAGRELDVVDFLAETRFEPVLEPACEALADMGGP